MKDQASNLRMLANNHALRFSTTVNDLEELVVVLSGKGGVGKSFLSLHLAYALQANGYRVLLVDANLHNPSIHVMTNTEPSYPLHFWIRDNRPFDERAVIPLSQNLDFVGNTAMVEEMRDPFLENPSLFLELLTPLAVRYDFVLLDTQTGLNDWNLGLLQNANLGLLVGITEPTSVIDTYILIKAARPYLEKAELKLVLNQVLGERTGLEAHNNLNLALKHFLNTEIELWGMIPFDLDVKKAGFEQKPLWSYAHRSSANKAIRKIAGMVEKHWQEKLKNQETPAKEVVI